MTLSLFALSLFAPFPFCLSASNVTQLEVTTAEAFTSALNATINTGAYQAASLWANVGVRLPGEVGLLAASVIPGVGESMDAYGAINGMNGFERWASRASLAVSGVTLGMSPNFGRFAGFVSGSYKQAAAAFRTGGRAAEGIADASVGVARSSSVAQAASRPIKTGADLSTTLKKGPNICFIAGTLVESEFGMLRIEDVQVGDLVWSRDDESGEEGWRPVTETFITHPTRLVHLEYAFEDRTGTSELVGTELHPFWSLDRKEWVPMSDLRVGERLLLSDEGGEAEVRELCLEVAPAGEYFTTYNFEVFEWHTYFVAPKNSPPGTPAVWVHNVGGGFCDEGLARIEKGIGSKGARYGELVLAGSRHNLPDDQIRRLESLIDQARGSKRGSKVAENVKDATRRMPGVRDHRVGRTSSLSSAEIFDATGIERLGGNKVRFQGVEVRSVRDYSHLTDNEIRFALSQDYIRAPRAPRASGRSDILIMHHHRQRISGPIIEMPQRFHQNGNIRQHPLGNAGGVGSGNARTDFNAWRQEYLRARYAEELLRRGLRL